MENQKTKIISIASIIALALTLVSATFAYFMAQTGEGKSTDIKINASTVDTLTFEAGSAISLNLNQDNFASGKGNQTDTTFAKAMLTANNKTNTATEHYYMYLNISENTFTYTQDANTPEILLTIKDANGNAITSITGLTYKTNVTDGKGASISGFDITTKSGLITLFDNREITANPTKTEQWNITVTFVNYNSNQAGNAGKSFSSKVMIQKEEASLLISYVSKSQLQKGYVYDLTVNVETIAVSGNVSKYYYSKDNGKTFVESDLNTYTFSDLDYFNGDDVFTYSIVIYASDVNGNKTKWYTFDYTPEVVGKIQYCEGGRYDIDTETLQVGLIYTSKYELSKVCSEYGCSDIFEVEDDSFKTYFSKDNFKNETLAITLEVFDVKGNQLWNGCSFSVAKYN